MFTLLQCTFQQRNVILSFQMSASVSSSIIKQERQCTWCVRATIVVVEKAMSITQPDCVFVALGMQCACAILSSVTLPPLQLFPYYLINHMIFEKQSYRT